MPFFKKFEVQKFLNFKWTEDEKLKLVALCSRRSASAVDSREWRQIKPGIYSLHYSREIAAEIVAGNEDYTYLPDLTDGVVSYWSPVPRQQHSD